MVMAPLRDFEAAGQAVLTLLQQRYGFELCMLARTDGEEWTVLQGLQDGHPVTPSDPIPWPHMFGTRVIEESGAPLTSLASDTPPRHPTLVDLKLPESFVGGVLRRNDGTLFGTICGVHLSARPAAAIDEQELMELMSALLCKILQDELSASEETRRFERLEAENLTDPLTSLYNRRAWDRFLESEEARCCRYGHPAAVMSIDLNHLKLVNDSNGHAAGDALLTRAASALRAATRSTDIVARLGGDEFGILGVECDRRHGESLLTNVRAALAGAGIGAATGFAMRTHVGGLDAAWEAADRQMYERKRQTALDETPVNLPV
jgi:diguanylate cyclase